MKTLLSHRIWILLAITTVFLIVQTSIFLRQQSITGEIVLMEEERQKVDAIAKDYGEVPLNLSRYARVYCKTANEIFAEDFFDLYHKFIGYAPHSINDGTYFSKLFDAKKIAMIEFFRRLKLDPLEMLKLNQAQEIIDKLAAIEIQAVNSVQNNVIVDGPLRQEEGETVEQFIARALYDRQYEELLQELHDLIFSFQHDYHKARNEARKVLREYRAKLGYGFLAAQFMAYLAIVAVALQAFWAMRQNEANKQIKHDAFVNDILKSIQDGIFVIDRDYTMLRTNPMFDKMYSEFQPLVGKKCWETSCLDRICDDCPAEKMFQSGKLELSVHYEEPAHNKEGMWLEHFSYPIFDEEGKIVSGVNFVRDVTKRKTLEESIQLYQKELEELLAVRTKNLAWSESKMQAVLDGAVPILFYRPTDGRVDSINSAMEQLIGYTASEMVGKIITNFYTQDTHATAMKTRRKIIEGETTFDRLDIPFIHKDGHIIWVDMCVSGVYDTDRSLLQIVGIFQDITEKHVLHEKLSIAKNLAENSARAKSEFLANMSHEIRTPMNAIHGLTYLCLQTELDAQQCDYLEKSLVATSNLLRIIDDILDFSKIEAGKLGIEKVPFKLSDSMREVYEVLSVNATKKGLNLRTEIGPDVPDKLIGDSLRLRQVLINLAGNAVKFTAKGEVAIRVELGERRVSEHEVVLDFSVSDTGIGMTEEQINRLFSSFTQVDTSTTRKYGGTGLGLVISRNLVELMGGSINVASIPEKGTTFHFTVRLAVDLTDPSVQGEGEHLSLKRILIVDDSETDREFIGQIANIHARHVDTAEGGEEAIGAIVQAAACGQSYDVVLVDWKMPRMDGIETIRKIRDNRDIVHFPEILLVSAYDRSECMRQATGLGVAGFLVKPVTSQAFVESIKMAVTERRSASSIDLAVRVHDISGARILLAEDNKINQLVAQGMLQLHGIEPTIANDGVEAVALVKEHDFDLILMDIQMPHMDGLEATQAIRKLDKPDIDKLPIIAMTAHAMDSDYQKSLEVGMNDHLTKPINPEKLKQTLETWIR